MVNTLLVLQKKLLSKSSVSELRIASNSGHMINFDQPEIIVDAIRDLIKKIG